MKWPDCAYDLIIRGISTMIFVYYYFNFALQHWNFGIFYQDIDTIFHWTQYRAKRHCVRNNKMFRWFLGKLDIPTLCNVLIVTSYPFGCRLKFWWNRTRQIHVYFSQVRELSSIIYNLLFLFCILFIVFTQIAASRRRNLKSDVWTLWLDSNLVTLALDCRVDIWWNRTR
jgi:hypothetical protein